jgi:hypothetical protein
MTHARITRRAILAAGAAGVASLALPLRLADSLVAVAPSTNNWTYDQFHALVGASFRVSEAGGGASRLTLLAADNMLPAGTVATSGRQWFHLTFSGDPSPATVKATRSLYSSRIGRFDLFLVPGASTGGEQHYTAVINRI